MKAVLISYFFFKGDSTDEKWTTDDALIPTSGTALT